MTIPSDKITVVSLGGQKGIGQINCKLALCGDSAVMLDAGIKINTADAELDPKTQRPDFDFIIDRKIKLAAIAISHIHMDHAAALGDLLKRYLALHGSLPPVITSNYSADVISAFPDWLQGTSPNFVSFEAGPLVAGAFNIEGFPVVHSARDSYGVVLRAAGRSLMYTGDIKLVGTEEETLALTSRLSAFGESGIDALMLDTTGVYRDGFSKPAWRASAEVCKIVRDVTDAKVIITAFSSKVDHFEDIVDYVHENQPGRQVLVVGRNLKRHFEIAGIEGWTPYTRKTFTRRNAVVLITGSQGELNSALKRFTRGELEGDLNFKFGDHVVHSASTIPEEDNIRSVRELLVHLDRLGRVLHLVQGNPLDPDGEVYDVGPIHESGHAFSGELAETVERVDPAITIPIHAGLGHRQEMQSLLAERKVVLLDDGEPFEF